MFLACEIYYKQLKIEKKNWGYLIRYGHTEALLLKKTGHKTAIFPALQKLTHINVHILLTNIIKKKANLPKNGSLVLGGNKLPERLHTNFPSLTPKKCIFRTGKENSLPH